MSPSRPQKITFFQYVSTNDSFKITNNKTETKRERKRRDSYADVVYENGEKDVLTKEERLGENSSFGQVYRARSINHPTRCYAIKVIRYQAGFEPSSPYEIPFNTPQQEAKLNETINGLGQLDYCSSNQTHYLLIHLIVGKTFGVLIAENNLSEIHFIQICLAILKAISDLHITHKKTHRDIKPDNIIINANAEAALVDFGLTCDSKFIPPSTDTLDLFNMFQLYCKWSVPEHRRTFSSICMEVMMQEISGDEATRAMNEFYFLLQQEQRRTSQPLAKQTNIGLFFTSPPSTNETTATDVSMTPR